MLLYTLRDGRLVFTKKSRGELYYSTGQSILYITEKMNVRRNSFFHCLTMSACLSFHLLTQAYKYISTNKWRTIEKHVLTIYKVCKKVGVIIILWRFKEM